MRAMKMILREDVKSLGKKGQVVEVAEGYGRNYLMPRGLAVPVTEGTLKEVNLIKESKAKRDARQLQNARELADRLKDLTVRVAGRAGEGGRLYGAVTSKDVADQLEKTLGRAIDKRKIVLEEPIKTPGTYPVQIRLYPGVQVEIRVEVVPQ